MLEQRINEAKSMIVEYGSLAQSMFRESIRGLVEKNSSNLKHVIEELEVKANDKEMEIEDYCVETIARFSPMAKDLRTILMILRMNNDLERMGDHAVNIAQNAQYLIERQQIKPLIDLPRMENETAYMVNAAIDSFINEDIALATAVLEHDNIVDGLKDQIIRELVTFMSSEPAIIDRAVRLIEIARNLERVADLATNIAEDVIFMIEGRSVKHGSA